MASHTIELSFLLRGFSDINEIPSAFIPPHQMIAKTQDVFFDAIGGIAIYVWGDERDEVLEQQFKKSFLEYFYMKEIGFQTPMAFYLELGNFLRRKLPIYCNHWRYVLDDMYVTSVGTVEGNVQGKTKNNDTRKSDSNAASTSTTTSDSETNDTSNTNTSSKNKSDATTLSGQADTAQNELDLDLNNLKYASSVGKTNAKNTAEADSESDVIANSKTDTNSTTTSNSEGHATSEGESTGESNTDSKTISTNRGKDVFDIYDQWIKSGYDLFTPIFEDCMREQIFHPLL